MSDLDSLLSDDRRARLLPTPGSKSERALTSILLATMTVVRPFARQLLKSWGVSMHKTSDLRAYTEVGFEVTGRRNSVRPDGVLVLSTRKRRWTALVEAKVGSAEVDAEQVQRYGEIARRDGIDAVITLSNQLAPLPSHVPYAVPKTLSSRVEFLHSSWISALTEARLILRAEEDVDQEQKYILSEMAEYFDHKDSGVQRFEQMNREWNPLVLGLRRGQSFKANSREVENTIGNWHQEARDICLILSRRTGERVDLRLSRKHRADPAARLRDDCQALTKSWELRCSLVVPNAASPMEVVVNLQRRTISCSMRVTARGDRKTAAGRVNDLLRQLQTKDEGAVAAQDVLIRSFAPGRGAPIHASLEQARNDAMCLVGEGRSSVPTSFEIAIVRDVAGRFSKRRVFVQDLEKLIPTFYDQVGQRLRSWRPPPPRIDPSGAVAGAAVAEAPEEV